jgi:hypothetical protein
MNETNRNPFARYHRRQRQRSNGFTTASHRNFNSSIPGYVNPLDVYPNVERVYHHYDTSNSLRLLRRERFPHLQRIQKNIYGTNRKITFRFSRLFGRVIQVERDIHIFHPSEDNYFITMGKYNELVVLNLFDYQSEDHIENDTVNNIVRFETIRRPPTIISNVFRSIARNSRRNVCYRHDLSTETHLDIDTQTSFASQTQRGRRIRMAPHNSSCDSSDETEDVTVTDNGLTATIVMPADDDCSSYSSLETDDEFSDESSDY